MQCSVSENETVGWVVNLQITDGGMTDGGEEAGRFVMSLEDRLTSGK